jgi:hypothetical protein
MEKLTIEQAIATISASMEQSTSLTGSLYTAQDVLNILQRLEAPTFNRAYIPEEWHEHFIDLLMDGIDESDIIEYDSAEFSLRYGNTLELDSVDLDKHRLARELKASIEDACQDINREIEFQETRERENAEMAQEDSAKDGEDTTSPNLN